DELGGRFADCVPRRREGALARPAEHLVAACEVDHLGHPVTGRERRVEPLSDEHALAWKPADELVHEVDAVMKGLRESLALRSCVQVPGQRADRILDLL